MSWEDVAIVNNLAHFLYHFECEGVVRFNLPFPDGFSYGFVVVPCFF